jgi:hypothetical protein
MWSDGDDSRVEEMRLPQVRQAGPRPDYTTCVWAKMIMSEDVNDPTTRTGKLFRRRFRTPWPLYRYVRVVGAASCPSRADVRVTVGGVGKDGLPEASI